MTEAAENTAKAALRIHMRAKRRELVREHPEADWQAGDHGPDMLARLKYSRPGVIAVYRASGNEMDPRPLADNLAALGWRLALPVCREIDQAVVFRAWAPGDRLIPDVLRGVLDALVQLVCAGMMFGSAWLMFLKAQRVGQYGDNTATLKIELAPFVYLMCLLILITGFIHVVKAFRPGDSESQSGGLV